MSPIRVFLAGLGQIAFGYDVHLDAQQYVYSHTRAFTQHDAYLLVGGCDLSAEARARFSAATGLAAWESINDAPADLDIDLVVVATPTSAHAATLRDALGRWRLRGVLCEKPLADDLATSTAMVAQADAAGVPVWVNYIRRADPGVQRVRAMIADGTIATPLSGVVWYSKGLLHNGSHLLDMMGFWLGAWQSARRLGPVRGLDADLDVQFERGRVIVLAAREEDYSHYTAELVAPTGRVRYDLNGTRITWEPVVAHATIAGYRVLSPTPDSIPSGLARYQWHVADWLVHALAGRPHPLATAGEALTLHRHLTDTLISS